MVRVRPGILQQVDSAARPWRQMEDMDALLERIGDAHYVLLGEASHGTSEFYIWRAQISRRLITEKGFSFIAVEGDWPECYQVNRYVKNYQDFGRSAAEALRAFTRWPTWMWANREIIPLLEWLKRYNADKRPEQPVGFYGLDVYSLWDSLHAVVEYLQAADPAAAEQAKVAYDCFEQFGEDPHRYALSTMFARASCEDEVVQVLRQLRQKAPTYPTDDEAAFDAEQNARVAVNAERYYRTMMMADAASWNIRDRHMIETLESIMKWYGPEAKAIVWAHNTHIGDARYADMAAAGMVNIGQLVRENRTEKDVVLVGFGTYQGTVIAGKNWDAPMQVMTVPPARQDSWEAIIHQARSDNRLFIADETAQQEGFQEIRNHRAIGVVYDPARERQGNYVPTLLPRRYDAFIYLDQTSALRPLQLALGPDADLPETFPWSV